MDFSVRLYLLTGYCVHGAVDSYMLILYAANLLNSLIILVFIIDTTWVSRFNIMLSTKRNSFTSVFQTLMPLVNFSCLIILSNTVNLMLNSHRDNGYPYLVLNLSRKSSNISH